jgi:GNAT superfamily N-acetyltransferase
MMSSSSPPQEYRRDGLVVSTDRARLDVDLIHGFLTGCYWARGISRELVARSMENALCFGMYAEGRQIGFARVISDYATYAYLGDVFILERYRGRGLSKWLLECIVGHPQLQGLRRWSLVTGDAHGLYSQFGFTSLEAPERWMEIHQPDVYAKIP